MGAASRGRVSLRLGGLPASAAKSSVARARGGAFLVPDQLDGVSQVMRVVHGDCANAVGAAIAQVSGEVDQIFRDLTRSDAIAAGEG